MHHELGFFQRMSNAIVAGVLVGAVGVTLLTVSGVGSQKEETAPALTSSGDATAFVQAWERMRTSTWAVDQTYQRRTTTGRSLQGSVHEAQRRPDYVRVASGAVTYDVGGRQMICGVPAGQSAQACREAAGLPAWDERVASDVAAVREQVIGPNARYDVSVGQAGCFELFARPSALRSTWGTQATFCFDPATGAPLRSVLRRDGGTDMFTTTAVRAEPTAGDFVVQGIA